VDCSLWGRILDGITGGNISTAQAYIADLTTKEDRAKGMGLVGAAFGWALSWVLAIGGILSRWWYRSAVSICGGIVFRECHPALLHSA